MIYDVFLLNIYIDMILYLILVYLQNQQLRLGTMWLVYNLFIVSRLLNTILYKMHIISYGFT
jgi:hypothetical protein